MINKLFPVKFAQRKDYLIIEDSRMRGSIIYPIIGLFLVLMLLTCLLSSLSSFWGFLIILAISILLVFVSMLAISYLFKRTVVFYKENDLYEIIDKGLFKTHVVTGNISEIKEIKLVIHRNKNDGNESFIYTSQIIPKSMILDDLRIQSLERETILNNYEKTLQIVYVVSEFTNVPYSVEEI